MTWCGTICPHCDGALPSEPVRHITQAELAQRWRVTTRTLDRWRISGRGPAWLRLNGRIRYRVEDVLAFEAVRLRRPKP